MESVDPNKLMHDYGFVTKEQGTEGRQTSDPEKTHPTGEFVIVARFGDHV